MLFVLAFIVRKEMRMALWHILPATALPGLSCMRPILPGLES